MSRYPTRNPFQPLIERAVSDAVAGVSLVAEAASAAGLVAVETNPTPVLVAVDPETGETTYPFELNSDTLNDPNARLYAL